MTATTATETTALTACAIARATTDGDLSCRAVVDDHIRRVEEVEGVLNAVVMPRFADARREADEADAARRRGSPTGPLHGVPVVIKDQFHVRGMPTTFGVTRLADNVAPADGPMVAALRDAGAIIIGKTNVPQGLGAHETVNDLFGRTNNPWDPDRTPGGSSGADAAIVTAGGVPVGLGADYGGSLRAPAAWCGAFTLKPTARRFPLDAAPVRSATGAEGIVAQPGPLARSTADAALVLRVMADAVADRPSGLNPPLPLPDPAAVDVASLRVALLPQVAGFAPAPAIRRALDEAAAALRAHGAVVERWQDPPDTQAGLDLAMRLYCADGAAWSRALIGSDRPMSLIKSDLQLMALPNWAVRALGAVLRASGQRGTANLLRGVRTTSADGLMQLLGDRLAAEAAFGAALDAGRYDAVLCPALPLPAPPHGATAEIPDAVAGVGWFNLLGVPAGVCPVTRVMPGEETDRPPSRDKLVQAARAAESGSAGLPVGVQVAARHWREDIVLAVMAAVEDRVAGRRGYPARPPL
jgi:fatty acid amide hydrolase